MKMYRRGVHAWWPCIRTIANGCVYKRSVLLLLCSPCTLAIVAVRLNVLCEYNILYDTCCVSMAVSSVSPRLFPQSNFVQKCNCRRWHELQAAHHFHHYVFVWVSFDFIENVHRCVLLQYRQVIFHVSLTQFYADWFPLNQPFEWKFHWRCRLCLLIVLRGKCAIKGTAGSWYCRSEYYN